MLIVGPSHSGKTRILQRILGNLSIRTCINISCTSVTNSQVIISKLKQNCLSIPSSNGRIMRPKNSDRLVLYIKDLHVVKRDRWGHSQVEALLRQVSERSQIIITESRMRKTRKSYLCPDCWPVHLLFHKLFFPPFRTSEMQNFSRSAWYSRRETVGEDQFSGKICLFRRFC